MKPTCAGPPMFYSAEQHDTVNSLPGPVQTRIPRQMLQVPAATHVTKRRSLVCAAREETRRLAVF